MSSPISQRRFVALAALLPACTVAACGPAAVAPRPVNPPPAVWAFTAPWDQRSDSSLRANSTRLDVAITGWIQLDSMTGAPSALYPDDPSLIPPPTTRLTLVSSFQGQRFHPEAIRRLAADTAKLAAAAARLATLASGGNYRGLVLDLEEQSAADTALTVRVARAFADSARNHGATFVAIAVPAADTVAYPSRALARIVDALVVMLYDEHWSTSAPGPIATPLWVRRTLGQRVADIGASRIVAALPVYGYLWRGSQPATPLGFSDARRAAAQASVELARDPASRSLHAVQAGSWELWMSDAELLRALRAEVNALGVTRIALWRLGLEDPNVWSVVAP
jgi:peptidoglycan-N-acetylglucosamine deacetylase